MDYQKWRIVTKMINIWVNVINNSPLEFFKICLTFESKTYNSVLWDFQCTCSSLLGLPKQTSTDWVVKQYEFIFSQFWSLKIWAQSVADLISSEASLMTGGWLSSPCVFTFSSLYVQISSSYKDTSHTGLGPTLLLLLSHFSRVRLCTTP